MELLWLRKVMDCAVDYDEYCFEQAELFVFLVLMQTLDVVLM